MVCRNQERANKARDEIVAETGNDQVKVLICDCSLESEIRRMWEEFTIFSSESRLGE